MSRALVVAIVILISAAACATDEPRAGAAGGIEIAAGTTMGSFVTELDTQVVYPAVLDEDMPASIHYLSRYARDRATPLRVRLMLGTDGAYLTPDRRHKPTLPAGWTQGDWDFTSIDLLMADVFAVGARPVLDIAAMPDWMWSCTTGQPLDPAFTSFGDYAARLVAYYNLGGFTAEDGRRVANPAGTSRRVDVWELWNEPNLTTLACLKGGATMPALSAQQYLAMWNAVAPKMRAVDPTIRLAGPATSAPLTGRTPEYVDLVMKSPAGPPDVITFHAYGSYRPDETDGCLLEGAPPPGRTCFQGGIPALVDGAKRYHAAAPGRPLWLTEMNVLASYGNDPRARNWNALGAAWQASAFARLGATGVDAFFQYSFVHPGGNQFSLLDWTRGAAFGTPLLTYWAGYDLARLFPPGSTLARSVSHENGVDTLAVHLATGELRVLVVNRRVAAASDIGGDGVRTTVDVNISGFGEPSAVTLWQIDAMTPPADGPTARQLAPATRLSLSFPGYGFAVLELR